jgi:hypothetical protein
MSAIPTITMHKVESSQFAAIGHVPELNLLAIQFHPKKLTGLSDIYHYEGVSAEMFAEFLGAESQGSFFIQRIKKDPARFPYTKVDQALFNHTAPQPVAKTLAESVAAPALTKELLAVALNGRESPFDLTAEEQAQAKLAGLLVIFGDVEKMVFRGARSDELDTSNGGHALLAPEPNSKWVEALWCAGDDATWTYKTDVPHATFEVMDDGIVYCRGLVISVADLGGEA